MSMDMDKRVSDISHWLASVSAAWPFLATELRQRMDTLTEALVNADNEQTRGRIKALREVLDMPVSLASERDSISAALAEQAAAD